MAGVPQRTLNWLFDVLKREYHDPNHAYHDVAQAIAQYPGLTPRTEVYTSDNGVPALLLKIQGTLPVNFRGALYQFPLAVWIPHEYPREAPLAYVVPTESMVVRPGQHVSASDGRIYHHYLAQWREVWDRSSITELLKILANVFSREPPVMAKSQQAPPQQQQQQMRPGGPPPIPPNPTSQDPRLYNQSTRSPFPGRSGSPGLGGPPPPRPPPKQPGDSSTAPPSLAPKPSRYDAPPPLPPAGQSSRPPPPLPQHPPYGNGTVQGQASSGQYMPQRANSLRQEIQTRGQPHVPQSYRPQSPNVPLPNQPLSPSLSQQNPQYIPARQQPLAQPPLNNQGQMPPHAQMLPSQLGLHEARSHNQQGQPGPQFQSPSQPFAQPSQAPTQQQQPPQHPQYQQRLPPPQGPGVPLQPAKIPAQTAPKDLLSEDDPFQIPLMTTPTRSNLPPPPIPTNPEKTALLSHLSQLILQHLHTQISQTQTSALPSLSSQYTALQTASQTLNAELSQLNHLSSQLSSNISALQSTLTTANNTISATQDPKSPSHPDNIPPIDQIIIPPTVVARQLYDAVAEQRGYEAGILALNEAFVRGRIGAEVWGRKVREYAREEMRRKWLVKKIGDGLGLEEV